MTLADRVLQDVRCGSVCSFERQYCDDARVFTALLDLDGTLVDRGMGFVRWARAFAEENDLDESAVSWLLSADQAFSSPAGRGPFFEQVARRFPSAGSSTEVWDRYRAAMPELASPYPGVLRGLEQLRRTGWRLVVVTNGRTDNQLGKLHRTGIASLLDGWCISEEEGLRKPDRRLFDLARERAGGVDAADCWVVGDDPVSDVGGGQASGMHTGWISHGRSWPGDAATPEAIWLSPEAALLALAGMDGLA